MATIKQYPTGLSSTTSSTPGGAGGIIIGGGGGGGGGGGAFVADCDSGIVVGQVVHLVDTGTSYEAHPVDITQLHVMPASGIVSKKYSSILCDVTVLGPVSNVYTGLVVGKTYWVAPDGTAKPCPLPSPPAGACYQSVGVAWSADTLFVDVAKGMQIVKT